MTFALCGTCNKAVYSWVEPSMLPGLPDHTEWTHFIRDEEHFAVPSKSIRERRLMCAVCRQPQRWYGPVWGWMCANEHCTSARLDKA